MRFEWDIEKSLSNLAKRGISLDLAEFVFLDPLRREVDVQDVGGEERIVTVGRLPSGLLPYVVTTQWDDNGDDVIGIISARKVTSHERRSCQARA